MSVLPSSGTEFPFADGISHSHPTEPVPTHAGMDKKEKKKLAFAKEKQMCYDQGFQMETNVL